MSVQVGVRVFKSFLDYYIYLAYLSAAVDCMLLMTNVQVVLQL